MHTTDQANLDVFLQGRQPSVEFLNDYDRWLAAQHRFNNSGGPLGPLLIALLDKHEMLPDVRKKDEPVRIDWTKVNKGRRVVVKMDAGKVCGGEFRGMGQYSTINVRLDGKGDWVDEFPSHQVTLDDEAPAARNENEAVANHLRQQPSSMPRQTPRFNPSEGFEQEREMPLQFHEPRIQGLTDGRKVKVERDGRQFNVTFKHLGPGDHQWIGVHEGEADDQLDVFEEEMIVWPNKRGEGSKRANAAAAKKGKGKKAAPKKQQPEPAIA